MKITLKVARTKVEARRASLEIVAEDCGLATSRDGGTDESEHWLHSSIVRRVQSTDKIIDVVRSRFGAAD